MPKSGEETTRRNYTKIYKDGELVGEMIKSKYSAIKGSKPKLKSDNEWEMKDELVGLGYTIKDVSIVVEKPIDGEEDLDCLGL